MCFLFSILLSILSFCLFSIQFSILLVHFVWCLCVFWPDNERFGVLLLKLFEYLFFCLFFVETKKIWCSLVADKVPTASKATFHLHVPTMRQSYYKHHCMERKTSCFSSNPSKILAISVKTTQFIFLLLYFHFVNVSPLSQSSEWKWMEVRVDIFPVFGSHFTFRLFYSQIFSEISASERF